MALVQELGLATFPQHDDGDVIFERTSRETAWRYRATQQAPQSMRLVGGTAALIAVLAKDLPAESVLRSARVTQVVLAEANVTLATTGDGAEGTLVAVQVVAAIPPRLLAEIGFSPPIDPATTRRWQDTATWMAPHAKFFATRFRYKTDVALP